MEMTPNTASGSSLETCSAVTVTWNLNGAPGPDQMTVTTPQGQVLFIGQRPHPTGCRFGCCMAEVFALDKWTFSDSARQPRFSVGKGPKTAPGFGAIKQQTFPREILAADGSLLGTILNAVGSEHPCCCAKDGVSFKIMDSAGTEVMTYRYDSSCCPDDCCKQQECGCKQQGCDCKDFCKVDCKCETQCCPESCCYQKFIRLYPISTPRPNQRTIITTLTVTTLNPEYQMCMGTARATVDVPFPPGMPALHRVLLIATAVALRFTQMGLCYNPVYTNLEAGSLCCCAS